MAVKQDQASQDPNMDGRGAHEIPPLAEESIGNWLFGGEWESVYFMDTTPDKPHMLQ